ncbi:hypothetical protein BFINE_13380 [Bacteroides finegoldii DSM 17565]|nr:hypothetical protein BFINE_13380 [Bacteroides finegoldii DSM 17565]
MEENELIPVDNNDAVEYTDDNIRHLSDMEHVRTRPGMYIGRLGDGAHAEDGIYVLLKEVIDNSIDEFKMQAGKKIEIIVEENLRVSVRDYGRGIPQGKLIEAVSMLNTGGKYDSKAFKKSVGLNGVGVKAVNALSSRFEVRSYRDGKVRIATFSKGELLADETQNTEEDNGTYIFFEPDNTLFLNYSFKPEFIETMLRNYTYLNTGLAIIYNGHRILSRNGLVDLLNDNMTATGLYPIIHLKGKISKSPSLIPDNTEKNTTLSSTVSILLKEVRIRVLSRSISPVPLKSSSTRTWTIPISATDWLPPLPSMWKNRSSRARPRPNWVLPIWLPVVSQSTSM